MNNKKLKTAIKKLEKRVAYGNKLLKMTLIGVITGLTTISLSNK